VAEEPPIDVEEDKEEVLGKLRDQVKSYVTAEKLRLFTERAFLTSVLEDSLGKPDAKERKFNEVVVIENVHKTIGIRLPVGTPPVPPPTP
jgi:hypothetical protein